MKYLNVLDDEKEENRYNEVSTSPQSSDVGQTA